MVRNWEKFKIGWLDKCLIQLISKIIEISLTSKVSYFMDTPYHVQSQYPGGVITKGAIENINDKTQAVVLS